MIDNQFITEALFYLFAMCVIYGGFRITWSKSEIHSIYGFFLIMFGLAGFYVYLEFVILAFIQVLVVATVIGPLIFFCFLVENVHLENNREKSPENKGALAFVVSMLAAGIFGYLIITSPVAGSADNTTYIISGSLQFFLLVALYLFIIGMSGLIRYRSASGILISLELIIYAAGLNVVAFSRFEHQSVVTGKIIIFIILCIAVVEAVVMTILISFLHKKKDACVPMDKSRELNIIANVIRS